MSRWHALHVGIYRLVRLSDLGRPGVAVMRVHVLGRAPSVVHTFVHARLHVAVHTVFGDVPSRFAASLAAASYMNRFSSLNLSDVSSAGSH